VPQLEFTPRRAEAAAQASAPQQPPQSFTFLIALLLAALAAVSVQPAAPVAWLFLGLFTGALISRAAVSFNLPLPW
jgi:hypothetical protein